MEYLTRLWIPPKTAEVLEREKQILRENMDHWIHHLIQHYGNNPGTYFHEEAV